MTDTPKVETKATTKVKVSADLELANTDWTLEAEVGAGDLKFKATAATELQLSVVADALYQKLSQGQQALPGVSNFPAIAFDSLSFETLEKKSDEPAGLVVHAKFDVNKSADNQGQPSFTLNFTVARFGEGAEVKYLAGIGSDGAIALVSKDAGVIGQLLGDVILDRLGLYYASKVIDDSRFFGAATKDPRHFPAGVSLSARIGFRESKIDLSFSGSEGVSFPSGTAPEAKLASESTAEGQPPPAEPAEPTKPELEGGARYWKDVNKTFGPLQLRRIGGEWIAGEGEKKGRLGLLLDSSISLAGLTVGLSGLSVNVEPSKLTTLKFEDLGFKLDGMALDFQRGPISISGMLLKGPEDSYSGKAMIRAATFSIGAIGAYGRTKNGESSFFIFGAFTGILGGPPCFVVQGIAAGFGYNRAIALPDIDKVRDFPLVELILPKPPSSDVAKALSSADTAGIPADYNIMFPPTPGQYWIAAGVYFSSFKLIETFALLTVQFGARLEIALLGVARMQQPPKVPGPVVPPFIVVEMAIKVRFAPDDGLLSVMAQLTANSFLFDQKCRLTGGFAFCVWFPPTNANIESHAGDFVLTLGGYHPKFKAPAHYPKVPRIGFDWQLPDFGVSITGEAYFALTPSFIMAGARLSAYFRSGVFSAWFVAYADFLIGWAPLQYQAEMGVRIGAAVTLRLGDITWTLSFEISAMLKIWGPPFAGEAYVDLGIVAFTIPIGDQSASREPRRLDWKEFRTQFLPEQPLRITITGGMVQEQKGDGGFIIVNPSELCLSVESFVPCLLVESAFIKTSVPGPARLGIRPMGEKNLGSTLTLTLKLTDSPGATPEMARRDIRKSIPEALWSHEGAPDATKVSELEAKTIPNVLMGVEVLPLECSQYPKTALVHTIKTGEISVPARPWQKLRDRTGSYYEKNPAEKRNLFRDKLKRPYPDAIKDIAAAGFGDIAVDVERIFKASDPTSVWLAAPTFVEIGNLPPDPHGA